MKSYDVVICGGGLAGLTLARQLSLRMRELSLLVIEKVPRPLPEACVKVGESSVELAAHYLGDELKLRGYLKKSHLPKLGLRFFFGDSQGPLEDRPEFGESDFLPVPSYQLDRGILENDLRRFVAEAGIPLIEDGAVEEVRLGENGAFHRVTFSQAGGRETARCRWLVDATGRRRLLQSQLGLKKPDGHDASAVWFRLAGRVDVEDLVSPGRRDWHGRVLGRKRYFSTNHLMGKGYWVWLIPLSSGNTSIGIVADEALHPFRGYCTHDAALRWLKAHEPALARFIGGRRPLDFKKMKLFSYSSRRVFSESRWACVGEAGVFADPFYSPGSDFIAISNSMVARMIELDRRGRFGREAAEYFNRLYLNLHETIIEAYRNSYPIFGDARVMGAKIIWDNCIYWGVTAKLFFRGILTRLEHADQIYRLPLRIGELNRRVQQLFRDWAPRAAATKSYSYFGYSKFPLLLDLQKSLLKDQPADLVFRDVEETMSRLEEMAQVLFHRAVSEALPQELRRLPRPLWVNAWAISLDSRRWEADGLFRPESRPRDLEGLDALLKPVLG